MRKLSFLMVLAALLGFIILSCEDSRTPAEPSDQGGSTTLSLLDGSEALGQPSISIASGTGCVAAGVGLRDVTSGVINFDVPAGATVKQVLIYWEGFHLGSSGDAVIRVNGNRVRGTLIGGPTFFFRNQGADRFVSSYRADITGLGLVGPGSNTLNLRGVEFDHRNGGAGVIVIFDEGTTPASIQIMDGLDLAFAEFAPPLDTTRKRTFNIDPCDRERDAVLKLFVAGVQGDVLRTSVIKVTVDGVVFTFRNALHSTDGPEWDTIIIPLTIPAGATEVSVQILSNGSNPASLEWVVAALDVPPCPDTDCIPCDRDHKDQTGKVMDLTLKNLGPDANIRVEQKKGGVVFDDFVPSGGEFTFFGTDKDGTLGTEIVVFANGTETKIHTSCSQPLGIGMVFGDFEVVAGHTKAGSICPGEPPPDGGCKPCDGKVTQLTLKNLGADANIRVLQKKDEDEIFNGFVPNGGNFTFIGTDKHGTMGTEILVIANGSETKIHTSCSQDIGPGLTFGNFFVVEGYSKNGGLLCPLEQPPGDGDSCDDGKPQVLTMLYTGFNNTSHSQDDGKVTVTGDPNGASPVRIVASNKKGDREFFDGTVAIGNTFDIDATNGGKDRLDSETLVSISNGATSTIRFHTSCSQPLNVGDQFGSIKLVGFTPEP